MPYRTLAVVCLLAAGAVGSLAAQEAPPAKPAAADAAVNQEILQRQFNDFERSLLNLAQRLERSSKPEDRERAANLKKAIALAKEQGVDNKFDKLVSILKSSKTLSLQDLKVASEQNQSLSADIKAILAVLMTDNRDAQLKEQQRFLKEMLKKLEGIIREQKIVRAQTEAGRTEKQALGKSQNQVSKKTEGLAKEMDKKDSSPGDGKSQDQQGKPGDKKDGKKPGQPSSGPPPESTPGKKQIQEANELQKQAEDKIQQDKKDDASKNQDKAIAKLEEARKQLEEILRQLREEERERLLAALQQRCERMLQLQIEVYDGTMRVDRAVGENPDKKPTRVNQQRALQLADLEEGIVKEANKCIQLLEEEGSAVAFPEVFIQVRDDMQHVARRLGKADVASVTQTIEQDIITTLKEMIEALKKAQQNKSGGKGGGGGGQQNQALIDLLAELKMIRSMQVRVNTRTHVYGEKYPGEQAADSDIQKELGNLAQRQQKIYDITSSIYRGKNR